MYFLSNVYNKKLISGNMLSQIFFIQSAVLYINCWQNTGLKQFSFIKVISDIGHFQSIKTSVLQMFSLITGDKTDFLSPVLFCLFELVLYVHSRKLRSCRDCHLSPVMLSN